MRDLRNCIINYVNKRADWQEVNDAITEAEAALAAEIEGRKNAEAEVADLKERLTEAEHYSAKFSELADSGIAKLEKAWRDIERLTRERDEARTALERANDIWRENMLAHVAAMRMVREAVEHVFGPAANLPSEEGVLLQGPEPHHEAEAIAAALNRVKAKHNDEIAALYALKGDSHD